MTEKIPYWDALIVTASNDVQAEAYRMLLSSRNGSDVLAPFKRWLVVPDPGGRRIGSGGSTLFCLMEIVRAESESRGILVDSWKKLEDFLCSLRVMIVHAGGDSRRLPAYAPCGKLFVPIPDPSGLRTTSLFDRLVSDLSALPAGRDGAGQFLVVSGDALLLYDAAEIRFDFPGMTAVCVPSSLEQCSKHGVLCADADGSARLYLQKPSLEMMRSAGAVLSDQKGLLDAGLMSFDARFAAGMMAAAGMTVTPDGRLEWTGRFHQITLEQGLDIYREICCALGTQSCFDHYLRSVRESGSKLEDADLQTLYNGLKDLPLYCQKVSRCEFLHFGTTLQLMSSAETLCRGSRGRQFLLNTVRKPGGQVEGTSFWVEGCILNAPVKLGGENVVTGVTVDQELFLPQGACLDIAQGTTSEGDRCWFIRPYGVRDSFKDSLAAGGTFCGMPLAKWLELTGIEASWIWDQPGSPERCSLWNARLFPACPDEMSYREWLWYFTPEQTRCHPEYAERFRRTPRYDCAQIAVLTHLGAFHQRRALKSGML